MMRGVAWLRSASLGVAALAVSASCAGDRGGTLGGSLQGFYATEYDVVRARLYSSELAIEYAREDGEVPVRVVVRRDDALREGVVFTLPESGTITGVSRDASMPPLDAGELTLTTYELSEGARIAGNFNGSFVLGRGELASLTGRFDTTLEIVQGVEGYTIDMGEDAGADTSTDTDAEPDASSPE